MYEYHIKSNGWGGCGSMKMVVEPNFNISGRIYAADNPSYQGEALYTKIKADLDLEESFCALPSG